MLEGKRKNTRRDVAFAISWRKKKKKKKKKKKENKKGTRPISSIVSIEERSSLGQRHAAAAAVGSGFPIPAITQ